MTLGNSFGAVFSMALNGFVCSALGWQWSFYIAGILGATWCLAFALIVPADIDSHPRMTEVTTTRKTNDISEIIKL